MLFLPIATKDVAGTESAVYTTGLYQTLTIKAGISLKTQSFLPLIITNIAVAFICLMNIFNYKKRSFQKRIAIISIILIGGFAFGAASTQKNYQVASKVPVLVLEPISLL